MQFTGKGGWEKRRDFLDVVGADEVDVAFWGGFFSGDGAKDTDVAGSVAGADIDDGLSVLLQEGEGWNGRRFD